MRKISRTKIWFSLLTVIFVFCSPEEEKLEPPVAVKLVPKLAGAVHEADTLEKGIDAIPESNSIYMEWYPNTEPKLAGYAIYRSEFPDRNFREIARVVKPSDLNAPDTSFIDDVDTLNIRYYYYIKAFDEKEQYGEASDTISYKLMAKPILGSPSSTPPGAINDFEWDWGSGFFPNEFVFRLQKLKNQKYVNIFTKLLALGTEYYTHQKWAVAKIGLSTPFASGMYRWRIDPIGSEDFYGAESNWLGFTVQ